MRRSPSRPLLVTSDPDLLDDLLRLAVRAGTEVEVAPDLPAARQRFATAPLVIFGVDVLDGPAISGLMPRGCLVIVCRAGQEDQAWQWAHEAGAQHIASLPTASGWLIERFSQTLESKGKGRVLAIAGGRGGAGASVLAAAMCVTAARAGSRALLIDADPLGGGADLLFGWEEEHGLRWAQLAEAGGRLDPEAFIGALPNGGDLVVLSCDRADLSKPERPEPVVLAPEVMRAAIDAGRNARDLVVVDLPRRFDAAAEWALRAADRALIVVPAEVRAVAAASRVTSAALACRDELGVIIRGPAPGSLNADQIAAALGLPVVGWLRPEPKLAVALERGEPPAANPRGPLARLCQRLIAEVLV
jgi:secretion/DNA translocation related CpaE-like protein